MTASSFPPPPKVRESRFDDWMFRFWKTTDTSGFASDWVAASGNVYRGSGDVGVGGTPTERLHIQEDAAAAASTILHDNTATASTSNAVQYVARLKTSAQLRNAFILNASLSDTTDGTRRSLVTFTALNGGAGAEVMRFDGTKIGVSGPVYRNASPEKVQYGGGTVAIADTFIAMKEGTAASPSSAPTYSKPMFYFERHTENTTKGTYCDWGNQRLSPAGVIEVIAYDGEQGCPTALATRTYTAETLPTQSVSSITRSGSTATATTGAAHGLATGDTVIIFDAVQTEYNGTRTVTVTGSTTFTYTVSGAPATPATGTILMSSAQPLHGIAALAQGNPGVSGRNREIFAGNFIASFPSGTKPPNLVGIEVDLIPSASCANIRPGQGNSDNFTGVWVQSAGGGFTCNTAYYATATGSGGWFYGMVLDCNFQDTIAYLRNTLDATGTQGLRVELARSNTDAYPIRAYANAGSREQFRVDAGTADAVWCLLGGNLKKLELGAADSGGAGYKLVRVTN